MQICFNLCIYFTALSVCLNFMIKNHLIIAIFICIFSTLTNASEHFSDHEQFCLQQPEKDCLVYINERIEQSELHSTRWYKAKSYLFDYYYDKNDYETLKIIVEPFAERDDLPEVFKVQAYFYYAKALHFYHDDERAKIYANKALTDIKLMYDAFADPMRMLELANLQYVFGNKESAFQMLLKTERKFGKSKDPIFNFELQSNKANIYHAYGDLENARESRKKALDWILPTQHQGKIIVAQGNLARTYQLLGQYDLAIKHYVDSLSYMVEGSDDIAKASHTLRLAEIYWQAKDNQQATKWFKTVKESDLNRNHKIVYEQLATALTL